MAGTQRSFSSLREEMEYYKARFEETQKEFEEFQQGSRELEMEMEAQLSHLEKENVNLKRNLHKVEIERDLYAEKLAFGTNQLKDQLETLEKELVEERDVNERLTQQIRELEQDNDDLERAKRVLSASLEEFEKRINNAIERNAFLESELDEKEELQCRVQRLNDEVSDLKRDAVVRTRNATANVNNSNSPSTVPPLGGSSSLGLHSHHQRKKSLAAYSPHGSAEDVPGLTTAREHGGHFSAAEHQPSFLLPYGVRLRPQAAQNLQGHHQRIVINPDSRTNPLNIVNDLLKRVGELETKMATAQFCM
ncbi:nuclear distribution protein nudE 1-like [Tropilaelaps mercedesae]|uniref:Nuclear distribution protein nudE 1-like n=1 Tax=Tropilaelaps mercedesae TaxID=418985 RepID=A0A1V9XS84_9ACAR|nr:nuclear distribution protein nudE 1-like [Tropilaelaps mercedesae]